MEKRWNVQFPISFFSSFAPQTRGILGDLVYRQNASPILTKKKLSMILNSFEDTIRMQNIIIFFYYSRTKK